MASHRFFKSISGKLLASTLAGLIVLALPLVIIAYTVLKDKAFNDAALVLQEQASNMALAIDRRLNHHLSTVVYTTQIEESIGDLEGRQLGRLVDVMRKHTPGFLWIGVTDAQGNVLAANDNLLVGRNVASRPWFQRGLQGPAVMDVHEAQLLANLLPVRANETYKFVDFTAPIRDANGVTRAVLGVHLDWRALITEVQQDLSRNAESTTIALVLGPDGTIRLGSNLNDANLLDASGWAKLEGVRLAGAGQSSVGQYRLADGQDYLMAFQPISSTPEVAGLGWQLVTAHPLEQSLAIIDSAIGLTITALLLAAGTTLLVMLVMGRRLSEQAMAYLVQVRNGDDPQAIEQSMANLPLELRGLSEEFLTITLNLRTQSTDLARALEQAKQSYWVIGALIEQAPVPIAMFDQDMNYVAASRQWVDTFAKGVKRIEGLNHYDAVPNLQNQWRRAHQAGLAGQSVYGKADTWTNPMGEQLTINWAVEPWRRPDGKVGGIIIMCQDITEEEAVRKALSESEERFKLAMDGAREGLWDWQLRENKLYYSPGWKRMLGYGEDELPNLLSTWEELTYPEDLLIAKSSLERALANPEQSKYEAEFRMRHKDGHEVHVLSQGLILRDRSGAAVRLVGTHVDKTEQLRLEARLRDASIAAKAEKESNAEKSRFLATISHEVRTPLNGVIGYAKLLEMDLPEGALKQNAHLLVDTASSLAAILNDVLDFAKLEAGAVKINPMPFALDQLVEQVSALNKSSCREKGLNCKSDVKLSQGAVYEVDASRLRQILHNLVHNAIKFTEQGSVTIEVNAEPLDEKTDWVHFVVQDTGMGISPEKQTLLFRPFSQVHEDPNQRYGGTGLGLSIVKSLVNAMGGDIKLESALGQGTRISVRIPLRRLAGQAEVLHNKRIRPECSLRVLIADDTSLNLKLLRTFLERDGHSVEEARDGRSVLDMAMNKPYDVILLDINMPAMDGYEVAQAIRSQAGPNQDTALAALTGYAFSSDIEKALRAGMNYHFAKPIDFDALLNQLAMISKEVKQ